MNEFKKLEFIDKYINYLDIDKKEYICKILIHHNIPIYQNNNGVYCNYNNLNNDIIIKMYDYIQYLVQK
jgi:hypothetical protein|tara:strand:+ start:189 stop:395 length:207 start_codon:yes stop_codon:yes gene_type:complete